MDTSSITAFNSTEATTLMNFYNMADLKQVSTRLGKKVWCPGTKKAMRVKLERVCWLSVLLISLGLATNQIVSLVSGWDERPFQTEERVVPKHKVAFPAVTICAEGTTLYAALETFLRDHGELLDGKKVTQKV